jgi:acetylornithine/N-succinyldiaminopimelate aminotransferase
MKEIVPAPPAIVRNDYASVRELFAKNVVPSYGRFELVLSHGAGSYVFDVAGKRYLDLGGGIAVNCLGHAHPAITEALVEQSKKLIHVSNLYFTEPQGRLAAELVKRIGAAKFFSATAARRRTKALFKLARKFGHDEGRFEILTATIPFTDARSPASPPPARTKSKKVSSR